MNLIFLFSAKKWGIVLLLRCIWIALAIHVSLLQFIEHFNCVDCPFLLSLLGSNPDLKMSSAVWYLVAPKGGRRCKPNKRQQWDQQPFIPRTETGYWAQRWNVRKSWQMIFLINNTLYLKTKSPWTTFPNGGESPLPGTQTVPPQYVSCSRLVGSIAYTPLRIRADVHT